MTRCTLFLHHFSLQSPLHRYWSFSSLKALGMSSFLLFIYLFEQVEILPAIQLMWTCYTHQYTHKVQPQNRELHSLHVATFFSTEEKENNLTSLVYLTFQASL